MRKGGWHFSHSWKTSRIFQRKGEQQGRGRELEVREKTAKARPSPGCGNAWMVFRDWPGVSEASGRDQRGCGKGVWVRAHSTSQQPELGAEERVPAGLGAGQGLCFKKNIPEGQSESWRGQSWSRGWEQEGETPAPRWTERAK